MSLVILSAVAVLAVCIFGLFQVSGEPRKDPAVAAQPVFLSIYGTVSPVPQLKTSWSYGYPAFEVTFSSRAQLESSAHLNAEFKRRLNQLFHNYGSADRKFDAELAAFFTYPGYIDEILAGVRRFEAPRRAKDIVH